MEERVDAIINGYMGNYVYISVGLIVDGEIILTKSYGDNRIDKTDVYASVTKPLTATICMMLIEEGLIGDVHDTIDTYSEKYGVKYITFQHLLSHESGIPHHEKIWSDGYLDLRFSPGTGFLYSTRGYGVLGDILTEVSGMSYSKLVREYIEEPVGASTFSVPDILFEAPGGLVKSSIYDMALFARGIMNGTYLKDKILYDEVWIPWARDQDLDVGLGWYLNNTGTDSLTVFHAGSNGKPRAFIALRPHFGNGLVLLGRNKSSDGRQYFYQLSRELMHEISR